MAVLNKKVHGKPAEAVYIGRPGPWGNPYKLETEADRARVIADYRDWLWERIQDGHYSVEKLAGLAGKDLVCWCAPKPCHGHVLAKAAKWAKAALAGEVSTLDVTTFHERVRLPEKVRQDLAEEFGERESADFPQGHQSAEAAAKHVRSIGFVEGADGDDPAPVNPRLGLRARLHERGGHFRWRFEDALADEALPLFGP